MKRFLSMTLWLLLLVQCAFASGTLPFGLKSIETGGKDETFAYPAGDVTYIFGSQGEGLIEVWKNGQKIYDFGTRPAWFMLKYMHQTEWQNQTHTTAKYYYPQLGDSNPKNNFAGYAVDPVDLPLGVVYVYEFTETELKNSNQDKTMVGLYFVISANAPLDGIMVYISVWNCAGDPATEKYRLMEVHCPYVRLPKIGTSAQDDVFTISNYLLEDPISTFKPIIEPYNWNEVDGNYEIQSGNYPTGFQVKAYYDQGEHPGRGVYMAMYNISREVAQNNLYKHQGGYDGWGVEWLGDEQNWPAAGYRDYLLWDIVRFTTDINQLENDYAEDLFSTEPLSASWNFCTFMKFYDSGLDWFAAASKYRETWEFLDDPSKVMNRSELTVLNFMDRSGALWPTVAAKYNPDIPGWAKYQPFYLYVSPQHPQSRHALGQPLVSRVREWQTRLKNELEVYSGYNNMMFSTWIVEWAEDLDQIQLYHNHPEWAGGWIPFDNTLHDITGMLNYQEKFFRDNLHTFLADLRQTSSTYPSTVRFISAMHGYLFESVKNGTTILNDQNDKLDGEFLGTSWPYNDNVTKRPQYIWQHMKGFPGQSTNELNFIWNSNRPYYATDYVPQRKLGNWELNMLSRYGMDYMVGGLVEGEQGRDLDFGVIDSQLDDDDRCMGADGTYMAVGGSVPFTPVYVGYANLNQSNPPMVMNYMTGEPIPPGGGTTPYEGSVDMMDYLQDEYSEKIGVNEGLGECFLDRYDIVMHDAWPVAGFVETESAGMCKYATELKIEAGSKDSALPVSWIPMAQAIAHDLVVFQGSQETFPPGLFWHTYLQSYKPGNETWKFRWTFYGGGETGNPRIPNLNAGWLAYNADMANGYTYGSKLSMFDVDAGLAQNGEIITAPTDEDTTNFWSDVNADDLGAQTLFMNCIKSYKYAGFPTTRDKVAEHLFFGRLQRTPDLNWPSLIPPTFYRTVKYDLDTTLGLNGVPINIELGSPAVMHTLWKANLAVNASDPEIPRLGFVFCNFTETGYTVQTKPVDLKKLIDLPGVEYWWYRYSSTATMLYKILNPGSFSVKTTVNPRSTLVIGITPMGGIQPVAGPYSIIDPDENLDLLQLEDGVLSVVFGDGTMTYDAADAVTVLTGVKDFSLGKISSQETVDIVCITKTGIEVLSCDQTGAFDTILESEGLFSDAVKIAQILESEAKYIVQDGSSLKQLSITSASGGKDNELFDIVTDEIICEPVRTFSIDNLCSDDTMDMVTITEDGSVELLNWSDETPESMVVIEIGTGADGIAFDDTDNDSDLDIILENSAKNSEPDVLTYVGDWKFTPED